MAPYGVRKQRSRVLIWAKLQCGVQDFHLVWEALPACLAFPNKAEVLHFPLQFSPDRGTPRKLFLTTSWGHWDTLRHL
eukprot:7961888-Pyramimonas_sp.AAC.1